MTLRIYYSTDAYRECHAFLITALTPLVICNLLRVTSYSAAHEEKLTGKWRQDWDEDWDGEDGGGGYYEAYCSLCGGGVGGPGRSGR